MGRKSRHPERDAEVARLWGQTDPHLTTAEIGARVNMSETAVSAVARRMGLPLRNRVPPPRTFIMPTERVAEFCRRYDAGEDRGALAQDFGISRSFLPRLARRLGLTVEAAAPITEADNNRLRALLAGGATLNEAAAAMGKARTTIGRMCKTLGITSSEDARFAKRRAGAQARWDAQQARVQARIEARQARPPKPGRQTNDGLAPRLRELVEGGHTISGAARIMRMPVGSMVKLARRHGIVPTAAALQAAIRNRPLSGAVVHYARRPLPPRDAAADPAPAVRFKAWVPGENDEGCGYVLQAKPVAYCGAPRRDRRCSYCAEHAALLLRAEAA